MIYFGNLGFSYNDWVGSFYSYTPQELSECLPRTRKLNSAAKKTFVFANNHWHGQAVSTIRQLQVMLD